MFSVDPVRPALIHFLLKLYLLYLPLECERVQKLLKFLHDRNTAEQIRTLTSVHDENRELVALDIARIVLLNHIYMELKTIVNLVGVRELSQEEGDLRFPVMIAEGLDIF